MSAVFALLSLEDLVSVIGHRSWKGVGSGETMMLIAWERIDLAALAKKLSERLPDYDVTVSSKDSEMPGGHVIQEVKFVAKKKTMFGNGP